MEFPHVIAKRYSQTMKWPFPRIGGYGSPSSLVCVFVRLDTVFEICGHVATVSARKVTQITTI